MVPRKRAADADDVRLVCDGTWSYMLWWVVMGGSTLEPQTNRRREGVHDVGHACGCFGTQATHVFPFVCSKLVEVTISPLTLFRVA